MREVVERTKKKKHRETESEKKADKVCCFRPVSGPAAAAFSIQMHDTELIQPLVNTGA